MKRFAPFVVLALAACASSPSSAPETEALKPAPPRRVVADSENADWREELEPGDVLRVVVWRNQELSGDFIVGPNGALLQPLYQEVPVVHLPPAQVRANVGAFLSQFQTNPQFIVQPLYRVLVSGEVKVGGLINVPQTTTISQAVGLGGGPNTDADLTDVRLLRRHTVTVYDLTSVGLTLDTLYVRSGDQIVVTHKYNFLRDYAAPIASLVTMFIAIGYYSRH